MTITTKEAAGLVAGGNSSMTNPNFPKSMFVVVRPPDGGAPKRVEIFNGMRFKAVRGFGVKGQSIAIGTVVTVGKEIDLELAVFLLDTSKAVILADETPFDTPEPKAKK